ncbi:hypothetical protein MFUL124B02_37265 [Myxococcus fulvus 124B02]|nr:hypothetical protein MFUL124B02_37265 [Myxococcus fulvus 124B02]
MSRINSFTGPQVQVPRPQAGVQSANVGFGSLLQQNQRAAMSPANRPGDPLMSTGGMVVQSALNSVGSAPHSGIMNSYLAAVGRPPIQDAASGQGAAQSPTAAAGSKEAEEQKVMMELAELSAATLNNSIFHMGNRNKVSLDRE